MCIALSPTLLVMMVVVVVMAMMMMMVMMVLMVLLLLMVIMVMMIVAVVMVMMMTMMVVVVVMMITLVGQTWRPPFTFYWSLQPASSDSAITYMFNPYFLTDSAVITLYSFCHYVFTRRGKR